MFIQHEKNGLVWRATLTIAVGLLLGGAAASFENQSCAQAQTPAAYCLTELPRVRVAQGMVSGMFASGGALAMIEIWGRLQKKG